MVKGPMTVAGAKDLESKVLDIVNKAIESWKTGAEFYREGCELYVKAIDMSPKAREMFQEAMPDQPSTWWSKIEKVGRGLMHPDLLVNYGAGYRRLERCRLEDQEKYIQKPIEFLTARGDTMKIAVGNLTVDQCQQVFAFDHVRSLPEQRAWIESEKNRLARTSPAKVDGKLVAVSSVGPKYEIKGRSIKVGTIVISAEEIAKALAKMVGPARAAKMVLGG